MFARSGRWRVARVRPAFAVPLASLVLIGCSAILDTSLRAGIGAPCGGDSSCQAGICEQSLCTAACSADLECPPQSLCLASRCRVGCRGDSDCDAHAVCLDTACTAALKVAAVLPGLPAGDDGWSTSQLAGLDEAASRLRYLRYDASPFAPFTSFAHKDDVRSATDAASAIGQFIAEGAKVVVTTSALSNLEAVRLAPSHPDVAFVASGATDNGGLANVGAYDRKSEQAWFVAGRIAARVASTGNKCIGMVLPVPTKKLVVETNAFVRGARRQEASVKVVIRWVGATRDARDAGSYDFTAQSFAYSTATSGKIHREELLAAQLTDLGCTLVGHRTETQRVVAFVETKLKTAVAESPSHASLYSLGVDAKGACNPDLTPSSSTWFQSCLGTVYPNWGGFYAKIFDEIHRGVWAGEIGEEPFLADTSSASRFDVSPYSSLTGIGAQDLRDALQKAADDGFDAVFRGPTLFTGQRDLDRNGIADADQGVLDGVNVDPEELARTCWFVDGTYELPDPSSLKYDSLIPAMVPGGPPVAGQVTAVKPSVAASVRKYGDVIDFIQQTSGDPADVMSCASH